MVMDWWRVAAVPVNTNRIGFLLSGLGVLEPCREHTFQIYLAQLLLIHLYTEFLVKAEGYGDHQQIGAVGLPATGDQRTGCARLGVMTSSADTVGLGVVPFGPGFGT